MVVVTTLVGPRVLSRAGGTLSRISAVTMRDLTAVRHSGYWLVVVSGFLEPVLYLLSIGIGVGNLVGDFRLSDGTSVSYAAFVAPAMLAASAMNGAMAESTFNFFAKLKWVKLYDGMVATPLRPFEIALGELGWALIRGALYSVAFLGIMIGLGLTTFAWAVPALFASLFVGVAFGGVGMAFSTLIRSWQDFDYVSVLMFAMFLFSGTFVPIDAYPPALRHVVEVTPLFQGVSLLRDLTTGHVGWSTLGHLGYLALLAALCLSIASKRMGKILTT